MLLQRRTQGERTQATRSALIAAAREQFAARGYHATPAEEIARLAGVTSGAIYHHFGDKRGLFRAVFEEVEAALAERTQVAARGADDPWRRLELGVAAYLEACSKPEIRQIVLVDGPGVLGWEAWHAEDSRYHLRPLAAALAGAMRLGLVERQPPLPLARLLLGALTEAGLAGPGDRAEVDEAALWLLRRLRTTG